MIRDVNFLGMTIAGSIVYLSLITFLRMLLWSNRKLWVRLLFHAPDLPLTKPVPLFLLSRHLQIKFCPHYRLASLGSVFAEWTSSMMLLKISSIVDGTSSLSLS